MSVECSGEKLYQSQTNLSTDSVIKSVNCEKFVPICEESEIDVPAVAGYNKGMLGLVICTCRQTSGGKCMKKRKLLLVSGMMLLLCMGCTARNAETVPSSEEPASEAQTEIEKPESDTEAFAQEIQTAVSNMDMEALAELCSYPLAVNGEVVENKEAFLELGEDVIFTAERCAVIAAVDVSALEETKAGFIMGDNTPNIIFKSVDGKLGITGIN